MTHGVWADLWCLIVFIIGPIEFTQDCTISDASDRILDFVAIRFAICRPTFCRSRRMHCKQYCNFHQVLLSVGLRMNWKQYYNFHHTFKDIFLYPYLVSLLSYVPLESNHKLKPSNKSMTKPWKNTESTVEGSQHFVCVSIQNSVKKPMLKNGRNSNFRSWISHICNYQISKDIMWKVMKINWL